MVNTGKVNAKIPTALDSEHQQKLAELKNLRGAASTGPTARISVRPIATRSICSSSMLKAATILLAHGLREHAAVRPPLRRPSTETERTHCQGSCADGLSGAAHHLVGHYSGGMIRRLEIAQSLLHRAPRAVRRARWDVGHWASHLACRCGSVTKVSMTARSSRTSR